MSFVSVVIPCYNAESYIGKCLYALGQQTFTDFDVILVDDCSQDNTAAIIQKFQEENDVEITYVKNEVNSGPAKSRNRGIELSESQYIAFCDSDDWYEKDYLQLMVEAAEENNADMVFCNSQKVLMSGTSVKVDTIGDQLDLFSAKEAITLGVDSLCALMVKRAIINEIPQPDIRNGEDMAIIPLMIMRSKKFGVVKKPVYNYLCRPGSLSLSVNERTVRSLEASFSYIFDNQVPGYETEIEYIGIKNVVYGALLNHFKFSSDVARAKDILQNFERKYPRWYNNKYLKNLALYKRIFVKLAKMRCFPGVKILCCIHEWITGKG